MINKITFKNFKLFKNLQTLELRPITIIIGKNNTGKSAVLKLPTMISRSLSGEFEAPLETENDGVRIGFSYQDLFYNKDLTTEAIEITIENEDNNRLEVFIKGDIVRSNNIAISKFSYNDRVIEISKSKPKFKGFTTKGYKFKQFGFDYIESFRKFPEQTFSDIEKEFKKIGTYGEDAFKLFAQYSVRSNPIFKEIQAWFKSNFEQWEIDVRDRSASSPLYEIVLSNSKIKDINLFNTGSGIKQSLPIIIRTFMPIEEETLIIVEEPETHLHPAAHGNLAERFVDSYVKDRKRRYLIETHSENFILRIQRMIAENKVKKEDVKIYYVDFNEIEFCSDLREIVIEDDGEIEDWPDNVFNESLDEVLKLRQAQKKRDNAS